MLLPQVVLFAQTTAAAAAVGGLWDGIWSTPAPTTNWTAPVSYPLNASIRTDILRRFSPVIYLHPQEAYLPADPVSAYERFLNTTSDELWVPEEFFGGEPAKVDAEGRPYVDAPITVQARVLEDGRVVLQYWYYHYFNGAQGFKTVTSSGRVTRFPWYPLAVHYADWEHTTIVLSNQTDPVIESVYYTVHADLNEPQYDFSVENGTHALVYSHNNSHACYKTPDDVQNTDPAFDGFINSAVRIITFGAITHIEIGDIGFSDFPKREWIRWSEYALLDITDREEAPEWAAWRGHWGPPFDQSRVSMPPQDVPQRRFFFTFLQTLYLAGRLTKFVLPAKISPRGPMYHYTWLTLDIYDPPARYIPEDPNGHTPNWVSVSAFVYFLLGFVGILLVLVSLLWIVLILAVKAVYIRTRTFVRMRHERRREMSERTPLL